MVDFFRVTKAANTMAIVIFLNALFDLLDIQITNIYIELKAMEGGWGKIFLPPVKKTD